MLNICKFQEYLGNSRKLILRNKEFKFWHLQNFIKEKSCQPTSFSMEYVGLTEQLLGSCEMELNVFFYLPNHAVCKKAYLEKHTPSTQ